MEIEKCPCGSCGENVWTLSVRYKGTKREQYIISCMNCDNNYTMKQVT